MKQELGPNQKAWIVALRSGDYTQGKEYLRHNSNYCCLGVACKMLNLEERSDQEGYYTYTTMKDADGDDFIQVAPPPVVDHLKLFNSAGGRSDELADTYSARHSLASLNDNGLSFIGIADMLEADPALYFREPA